LTTDGSGRLVLVVGNLSAVPVNGTLPKATKPKPLKKTKHHKHKRKRNWWSLFGNKTAPTMDLPKPVLVMGFPKAGTSSIFSFFQHQGFSSQHWYCCRHQHDPQQGGPALMAGCIMKNLRNNATNIFNDCGKDIDVFSEINGPRRRVTDKQTRIEGNLLDDGSVDFSAVGPRIFFPQHFHLDKIHDAFPNATWILNHRPVDDWIDSVMEWGDHLDRQFANEYFAQQAIPQLPTNQTEMRHFLKTMYNQHMTLIRNFCQEHPTHTLVEVTITDEEAGVHLADAFGLESKWWNHRNKNLKGTLQYYAQHHMSKFVFEFSPVWWTLVVTVTAYVGYTVTPGPLLLWLCSWW
jgi:hypothetical protein